MDQPKKDKETLMPEDHKSQSPNTKNKSLPAMFGGVVFILFALYLIFTPFDFSYPLPQNSESDNQRTSVQQGTSSANQGDVHQFDNIEFTAPGEWKVEMQGPVYPDRGDMYAKIITSSPFQLQMTTTEIPPSKLESVKEGLVYDFKKTNLDVQDYVESYKGTYVYAGGWEKAIVDGVDSIEAMYSILDTESNTYTMVSFVGPITDKAQVIEIFKSAKYKGMPLYH